MAYQHGHVPFEIAQADHIAKGEEKLGLRDRRDRVVSTEERLFDRALKEQRRQAQMSAVQARALHRHPEAQLLEIIVEKYDELREELAK